MKKFITYAFALLILVFTFSLSACGEGDVGDKSYMENQSAASEISSQASSSQAQQDQTQIEKKPGIDALADYFIADGLIKEDTKAEVAPQVIGAKEGLRYTAQVGSSSFNIEFYEFDVNNLNETAEKTLSSIRETGQFELLNTKVNAVISNNGKYIMIYDDKSDNPDNLAEKEKNTEIFVNWP